MKKFLTLTLSVIILSVMSVSVSAAEVPNDYIAYFSFDDAEAGLSGGGAYVIPNNYAGEGAEVVIDTDNAHKGGSVHMSKSFDTPYWLEAYKEDGTSLLAGLNEVTIAFWSNTDGIGPNWSFFGVPIIDGVPYPQVYLSEHYIGLLENTTTEFQRFHLDKAAARDGMIFGDQAANEWKFVTVTITETESTIYYNGEWWSSYALCDELLTDILTDEHMFYLGLGTWGTPAPGGEIYSGGYIDEFYVFPYAMDDQQVADLCVATGGEAPVVYPDEEETDEPETEAPETDAPETEAPAADTTAAPAETEAPAEEGGCGSSMSVAALTVALIATLGCAVVKKH